jgi:hypothetical protein
MTKPNESAEPAELTSKVTGSQKDTVQFSKPVSTPGSQRVSQEELKDFAIVMTWAFPLFFAVILPWLFNYAWQWWPFAISAVMLAMLFVAPSALRVPHYIWMKVAGVIGWINTRLILGVCFYLLITPLGVFMSLLGKLQYRKKAVSTSSNYVVFDSQLQSQLQSDSASQLQSQSNKENLENPF